MPEKTTEARGAGGGGDGGVIVPADAGALWHRLAVLCEELARRIEEDRRLYGPNKLGSTLNLNHPAIEEAASIADMLGLPAPILVETEERPPGKDEWPADLDLGACEPSSRRVQITTATVTLAPPLSGETDHGEKFLVGTNYLAGPDSKGGWVLRPSCPANLDDMARRVITALDRWARHARRAADESKPGGAHWQDAQSFAEGVKARALMHVPGAVGAMRALARSARATKRVDAAAGWPERDGAERALRDLEAAGRGRCENVPAGPKGGRPTLQFRLYVGGTGTETHENQAENWGCSSSTTPAGVPSADADGCSDWAEEGGPA